MLRWLLAACAGVLPAMGLAAVPKPEPAAGERVLDTFEVGADAYVRALYVDAKANALWVGTSLGVHEIDLTTTKARRTFTRAHGLASEYVFAIGQDAGGHTWFGTNAGGASRYRNGKWQTYFPMHGLADYWVYAFANDKAGDLWIGTWAGVSRFNPKTRKFANYVKELVNEWVYGLGVDRAGRVWFATEGGVSMYNGKDWRSWTHKDGLGAPNAANLPPSQNTGLGTRSRHDLSVQAAGGPTYNPNYVFSILIGQDDSVWAGTWGGGVSRYDGHKWANLAAKDGLAGNIVYRLAQDRKGVYWFGSDKGVSRYDGRSWRTFGRAQGMLDDHVYALAVAPDGRVWAGTKRGVARIGTP